MSDKLIAQAIGSPEMLTEDEISALGSYATKLQAKALKANIDRSKTRTYVVGVVLIVAALMTGAVRSCESCNTTNLQENEIKYNTACEGYEDKEDARILVRNMCRGFSSHANHRARKETSE